MGFNVMTYTVPSGTSRDAIKSYIQLLWGTPDAPDYILTVEDTSGSTAGSNTIPRWLGIDSNDSIVGLSAGGGIPDDYIESDLSAAGPCHTLGDLNCDGAFSGGDIDPFFLVLGDPTAYQAMYPNCDWMLADMNCDGTVNGADIDEFFACLGTGGSTCPWSKKKAGRCPSPARRPGGRSRTKLTALEPGDEIR